MAVRNGWKRSDWLIIDEESGVTKYASEVQSDYRGLYVTKAWADIEQPQDFAVPLDDPRAIPFSNPPDRDFEVCNIKPLFVGNTSVKTTNYGPGESIYGLNEKGISDMQISCSFFVR